MSYVERIAEDWVYTYSNEGLVGSKFDPLFVIEAIIDSNPSFSWLIIDKILEKDLKGITMPMLVFGPMESWMSRYAKDWIEFIEGEARVNLRFKRALGGLRQNQIDNSTWSRIEDAREAAWLASEPPDPS